MYRVLILVTVFLVAAWADLNEDMEKCLTLLHPTQNHCCKGGHPPKPPLLEDSAKQECMQLQRKGPSCDRDICFASKLGFASSDGKIDKAALQGIIEKEYEDNAELLKLIIDNCIKGDYTVYGKPDMCDLMKFKICKDVQFAQSCPEWDDEGPCAGVKELAEECSKKFS